MIDNIKIKNFQSHVNSKLDFHPGLNVIIGETDAGKSSILRALKWLLFNKPEGDSFITFGENKCLVKITEGQNTISKIRKGSTKYKLNDSVFAALHGQIPDEISSVINMNETNLQEQADGPFLLNRTPGEVGRFFNSIAGLDKIDKSVTYINSEIRTLNFKQKHIQEEIEKKQKELENYSDIETIENQLIKIEQKYAVYETIIENISTITGLIKKWQRIKEKQEEQQQLIKAESLINEIIEKKQKLNGLNVEIGKLEKLCDTYSENNIRIGKFKIITKSENVINKALEIHTALLNYERKTKTIKAIISGIQGSTQVLKLKQKSIDELEKYYHDNFPSVCPLCNQIVKK